MGYVSKALRFHPFLSLFELKEPGPGLGWGGVVCSQKVIGSFHPGMCHCQGQLLFYLFSYSCIRLIWRIIQIWKNIVVSNQVIVIYSTVYFNEAVHCPKTVMYQWKYCYHNDNYSYCYMFLPFNKATLLCSLMPLTSATQRFLMQFTGFCDNLWAVI